MTSIKMKILIPLVSLILLSGCSLMTPAGKTSYELSTPDGLKGKVVNTKDYESFSMIAKKGTDGSYSIELKETGVSASDPLKTAQAANERLLNALLKATIPVLP